MGHFGIEKTFDRVARKYYWRGYFYDVKTFIQHPRLSLEYKVSQLGEQSLMGRRNVEVYSRICLYIGGWSTNRYEISI